jgi:guanylate kinase
VKGLYIVSGPSGAGKSSLCREVLSRLSGIRTSISHTTREPRGAEQNGVHYHFVDHPSFEQMIKEERFAEWTQIHSNYYGTSHEELKSSQGDLILEIEGHGALQIKGQYPDACTIFILAPSMEEFRNRLVARNEDSDDEVERRLENVRAEIQYVDQFDYIVINDEFAAAAEDLITLIRSGRMRRKMIWPMIEDRFRR